jgi:CheY-like chemotaxis protein
MVTVTREDDDAVVRVRDTGMGIAPESLPRVFDFFVQAEETLDRAQGGLGIGLAVVKHLVELHGGRVEAHSDGCGTGAELVVRLPSVEPAGNRAPQDALAKGDDRARVLVVEDDAEAAELTTLLLEHLGHRVRTASDGPSALQAALADPPDVMLIDIGLAGVDGYEIAQSARRHESLRHVSLVALTGYSRDEDRQQALSAGFDYHLAKPVNVDELLGLVARLAVPKLRNEAPL